MINTVRLTTLAHGGGCGCKLAPSILRELLSRQLNSSKHPQLLVGNQTADDAAVWKLTDDICIVATTDFFTPIVDDPYDFGRIAAANAVSDIYAMGAKPLFALAILGMPLNKLPTAIVQKILDGGASICSQAGILIAGGHSIDTLEPIYGLAVIGVCTPDSIRRNATAQPDDDLILTKALGVGVYSAALRRGALNAEGYDEMLASTTKLNAIGDQLAMRADVHAMTDVTGFGLLGHAMEIAKGSSLQLELSYKAVPFLRQAEILAKDGFITGASARNWASYGANVELRDDTPDWQRDLLTDPQTSGGLLVCCSPQIADDVLHEITQAGFTSARVIGKLVSGPPGITLHD